MTTDKEQAAIRAVIDKAVAAGMDRGQVTWAIEALMNMQPVQLPQAHMQLPFGMTIAKDVRGPALPAGTTSEQMQAAEEYVIGRIRRYWGLE